MSEKSSVEKEKESIFLLHELYDALEYDKIDENEIRSKIKALADTIEMKDVNNISLRFRETALLMEKNISLFNTVFGHVDITTAIIKYLNNCGEKLEHNITIDEDYYTDDAIPILIMYVLFNLSTFFYEDIKYFLQKMLMFTNIPRKYSAASNAEFEVILLEDADLHSFMSCLTGMYGTNIYHLPTKILVQEPIKDKFLQYIEYYETQRIDCGKLSNIDIKVFRSKQELLTPKKSCFANFASIWSEDVTTAKNLAASLNRDCVFINVYYEFYSGAVLLPIHKLLEKSLESTLHTRFECDCDNDTYTKQHLLDGPINNLFYNGLWQKPVEDRYWVHNDNLWAQAEWNDVYRCVLSASQGFKIWSATSIDSRIQILLKFAHSLECTGNVTLANIVLKWIKFPYIYESSIVHSRNKAEKIEVTKIREGRNIIIIKEQTEIALFDQLIQTLIAGNSVIILCDANSYSFAPYCDMMSASKMPPGVVNLLSHKIIHHLELYLCGKDYAAYKKRLFLEDNPKQTYKNLTVPKHILLYL